MKLKVTLIAIVLISSFGQLFCQSYNAQRSSLVVRWDDTSITPNTAWVQSRYNACYGWADSVGNEYAIIGSQIGTHIIDLSNPVSPVQADFVPGRRANCVWREYKTYSHYLYMVSDDASPNSFQIADMSYLPDSVHVVYDSDSIFSRAHTIYIDGDKLYAGTVTTANGGYSMAVYSLANPEKPLLLRTLSQDYPSIPVVHDMFVRNDTVYASCGFSGLHVFLFDSNNTFIPLDSFITAPSNYNHSSYLSEDGQTLFFCEEVPPSRPIIALDVSDLSNITARNSFYSNQQATPHNPYVKDNLLYVAYYQDGLQVFDITNPLSITKAGFFDTYPFNSTGYLTPAYQGAWGAYMNYASGLVIVSDMQSGLFVLNVDSIVGINELHSAISSFRIYPNPTEGIVNLELKPGFVKQAMTIQLTDLFGRLLNTTKITQQGADKTISFDAGTLQSGIYLLEIYFANSEAKETYKLVIK